MSDNYVIDEARGMVWSSPSEALRWYRDRLDALEAVEHWNSAESLPPVGCPIVLRIGCAVVQAERTAHIERRDREMTYKLPTGQELVGRYEWSYP